MSEWTHVVDARQFKTAEGYADVPRLGRKNRMGSKQRERLWPVFQEALKQIETRGFTTEAGIFHDLTAHYGG